MTPRDLLRLLRRQPFVPFRMHLSNGGAFEIRHPDQAIVMPSRVLVGAPIMGCPTTWSTSRWCTSCSWRS